MWACSLIGALIANALFLPRVIGMLVAGILLQNIPWAAIDAFPPKWGTQMRAAALATIFLRCGLELDFGTMRKFKYPSLRLALIPGLAEALYDAGLGVALFGMDYTLALCMGFILKAVGPGLVVPAMFRLQRDKMGTDQGIPATVVIAASFDDIVAITGYAIFSTIAIRPSSTSDSASDDNVAWSIASGPLQVVFGILGGMLAGFAVGATRIWDTHLKRFFALFGSGMLLMFFLEYYGLLSGGALGALITGLVASNLWEKGEPRCASLGPSYVYSPECERWMSLLWRWVMEPILFVTVGSTLDFEKLNGGTIPKAVCIVLTGVTLRMICTYIGMSGFDYTKREKLFYSIAWTPKATVQAALSAAPLTLIQDYKVGDPDYDQWVTWGNDILTTGLFAIILCGTLGVLAIHFTAPVLLRPAVAGDSATDDDEEEEGGGENGEAGQGGTGLSTEGVVVLPHVPSAAAVRATSDASKRLPRASGEYASSTGIKGVVSDDGLVAGGTAPHYLAALVPGEDLALVAEYIDSIHHLTAAVSAGEASYSRDEVQRLSARVQAVQARIESEVGQREPSVRELFRTASFLRQRRRFAAGRTSSASRSADFYAGRGQGSSGPGHAPSGSIHSSRPKSAEDAV